MNSRPTTPSDEARRLPGAWRLLVQRPLAAGRVLKRWAARRWRNGSVRTFCRGGRPRHPITTATAPHAGFTLIELMVVLVILALLAGLVGPQLFGKVDSSRVKTAETQVKMLRGALQGVQIGCRALSLHRRRARCTGPSSHGWRRRVERSISL